MTIYRSVRNWVDHMLGQGARSRGVLFPAFPPFILPVIFGPNPLVWVLTVFLAVGWLAFVAWRVGRVTKASCLRADRAFDQTGKFNLSNEYHTTESATSAARRRRNG